MMIKALIFDLDGTIADTLDALCEAVNMTLSTLDFPPVTRENVCAFVGDGSRKLVERSLPASERTEAAVEAAHTVFKSAYARTYLSTDRTYPGLDDALQTLRGRGYRLAVLSNKPHPFTQALIAQLLPGLIEARFVLGQRQNFPTKPDPTVPLALAADLGATPAETAFIGDSDVDIRTARAAGFLPVGVAWGFRPASLLRELGAAEIAQTPADLTRIFP